MSSYIRQNVERSFMKANFPFCGTLKKMSGKDFQQKRQTTEQNSNIQQTLVSYLCVALIIFQQEKWSSTLWSPTLKTGWALSHSLTSYGTTKWSQTASFPRTRSSSFTPTSPKTRLSGAFTTVSRAKARTQTHFLNSRVVFWFRCLLTLFLHPQFIHT